MLYVANAFSLSMLSSPFSLVSVEEIDENEARFLIANLKYESCVGHESTAKVLSQILGEEIPAQRKAIKLSKGDKLLVFQLLQRLPEGAVLGEEELKKLNYKFYLVEVLLERDEFIEEA